MKIVLISCVSQKQDCRTKAGDMYTSPLFIKCMQYAKSILNPDKIFILSAKYGLLPLDKEIDPYNVTLLTMKREDRRKWADMILSQLKAVCNINSDNFIFLAGKKYYEDLMHYLPNHSIPMEGLAIGKMLQWLNVQLSKEK
jgi:cytoplasmic iron level regulating protein YaaA (DUF328/UPF0246 family)